MRILYLGINYWPDETGIAPFNTLRCEYLAARGHEVTALTGFPYYPQWRVPVEYRRRIYVREQRNGVALIRSWLYVPGQATSFKRIIHEASFSLSVLFSAISKSRPDVIFVVSPPLPLTISARILSRLWGIPYVLHVEDLQPDAAVDLGMLRSGWVTNALYALERMAYRGAAFVLTLNDAMASRIRSKGVAAEKTGIVLHGADPVLFGVRSTADGARFREAHRLEGKFLVVHAGNMGVKQGLEVILGAAARSREIPEITYLLVGDGASRSALERRAVAENLDNVRFLPQLPISEFHDLLATAEVSLVTQQRVVADILFPSKVETLMAVGQPIIASLGAASTVAEVLRKSGAGDVVEPEDPCALLDAILALRRDPQRRAVMGLRGQAFAREHWDRQRALNAMESALVRVHSGYGGRSARTGRTGSTDSSRAVAAQDLPRFSFTQRVFRNRHRLKPEEKDERTVRP
jgi:colanic acid biosynthesis glycosyl transferase WcaI